MGMLNILVQTQDEWHRLRRRLDALGYVAASGVPAYRLALGLETALVLSLDAACTRGKGRRFACTPLPLWKDKKHPPIDVGDMLPILDRVCPAWRVLWWRLRRL